MGEPDRSAQSTKSGIGIVSLLQNVQVVEITAAVAFGRVIGTDNTSVGIALINFLVVVGVAEIVVARSVDNAGAAAPSVVRNRCLECIADLIPCFAGADC